MTNELVFVETQRLNEIPFTTSDVVAEFAGVQHHAIQQIIRQHESDFQEFGRVAFEMRPLQTRGGIQNQKIYYLNEQQATLLVTYLRNTAKVRAFKKELVRQFYAMRSELNQRAIAREARKPTSRELTDVIRDCVPNSPHKNRAYKN